ncbi:MAG: hypothetical protein JXR65_07500, partial [Bacteroidales bacterium]|nr:hypothetical protein [Bacteroidales bacterium]
DNDLFRFNYDIFHDKDKILIVFKYYFKKSIYPADYYLRLKNFFKSIVDKGNDRIVLKKE